MGLRRGLVVVLLVLLHFLLHVGLGLQSRAPDLLTLALLIGAREVGVGTAAGLGFLFGVLEDGFSILAFGANALAMTLVGVLAATTRDLFVGDSLLFIVSYLFVGKFAKDLLHWVFAGGVVREPFVQSVLLGGSLSAVYMTAVGLVVVTLTVGWWEGAR